MSTRMDIFVKRDEAGRDFDVAYWQEQGPAKIFDAALELIVLAAQVRGIDADQVRLQRSVARIKRRRSPVSGSGRVRRDALHGAPIHEGSGPLGRS